MGPLAAAGCAWQPWLRWEVGGAIGAVVARHAAGRNGGARPMGAFSTAGARHLRAFLHYSSSHNRASQSREARLWLAIYKRAQWSAETECEAQEGRREAVWKASIHESNEC